jgi:glycosyltransferase involved in cell wall biosynthesis
VVTIPDANWKDLDTMSAAKRRALGFFVRRSAKTADVILTGTRAAAATLEKHLPADRGRIAVVPLGADHLLSSSDRVGPSGIDGPYLLALSGTSNHKNIPRLVQAFARVADAVPHKLVIAGIVPSEIRACVAETSLSARVEWTGYVSDGRLASLLAGAALFVFPSWHEGFGLPLLEAQRFGTPVAAAAIPALVEIANGSAELFDPFSTDSIASAILQVLKSSERRNALADAARRNAAAYTWDVTARATLGVYEEVAAAPVLHDRQRRSQRQTATR